tara:strand:- start:77 stop:397 length:321 start_codon:yes stop_codon:yes gene_type:complete
MDTRDELLDKAKELVTGDRDKEYGDAFTNFNDIAQGWGLILGKQITREDIALCMIWVKMARLSKTPSHQDSWIDIAGYAGLGGEIGSMDSSSKLNHARHLETEWQV